ncbi:MAG: hypothetical protein EPN41_04765 [Candidimonas sp.]|nr:MAG: hypothetical protein EPN41_04765 [Candidimonas sp.]
MKYGKEVIELMACYPGRDFKMEEIVRSVASESIIGSQRTAVRQSVLRVLQGLIENGSVLRRPTRPGVRNAALYRWKSAT